MEKNVIREMTPAERESVVAWAGREGWNPGQSDARIFGAVDPEGFFCADWHGEMVGGISAVAYGKSYGFVGLFIVRPDLRGHRVGLDLADRALAHLEGRIVGIDGVLAKEQQYAKFYGFVPAGRNIRFEGNPLGRRIPGLVPATEVPFADLAAYDRRHFPAEREGFLRDWISQPGAVALADTRGGSLRGFGVRRPCLVGGKIGPLFADDAQTAEDLFLALCDGEGPVFLDTPGDNSAAPDLARRFGMKEVFATTRMYRGGTPEFVREGVFGVTTFELG